MSVLQGGADWHRRQRAHRPGHAHAKVVGVLALAYTAVSIERAALWGEEAATTQRAQAPAEQR